MGKFSEEAIKADYDVVVNRVETWFAAHFSHVTPGTPDWHRLIAAKDHMLAEVLDLLGIRKPDAPTQTRTPTSASSE